MGLRNRIKWSGDGSQINITPPASVSQEMPCPHTQSESFLTNSTLLFSLCRNPKFKRHMNLSSAIISIKNFRLDHLRVPTGTFMSKSEHLVLDCDQFDILGSMGEAVFGTPHPLEEDKDMALWIKGLGQGVSGGLVYSRMLSPLLLTCSQRCLEEEKKCRPASSSPNEEQLEQLPHESGLSSDSCPQSNCR